MEKKEVLIICVSVLLQCHDMQCGALMDGVITTQHTQCGPLLYINSIFSQLAAHKQINSATFYQVLHTDLYIVPVVA